MRRKSDKMTDNKKLEQVLKRASSAWRRRAVLDTEYRPETVKEGFTFMTFSILLYGSLGFGFLMGGWYWIPAVGGIGGAVYGFWKMKIGKGE